MPTSDASTSTTNCSLGSGRVKKGAEVNMSFRRVTAKSAERFQVRRECTGVKWSGHRAEVLHKFSIKISKPEESL